jgi:small subunit ribosomal protein S9
MTTPTAKVINTSGKRKTAKARASLWKGPGSVRINSVPLDLFTPAFARERIREPLLLAGKAAGSIDIDVNVCGGGRIAQAEAARLAIAKGIVAFTGDEALKKLYLAYDRHLLVADPRRTEASKPNRSKPRAARQKSYR